MHSTKSDVSDALKHIARKQELKQYILHHEEMNGALLKGARRFIAGTNLQECVEIAKEFNKDGIATTIDYMGEDTADKKEAVQAFKRFRKVISAINESGLQSSVSLDLSHIGLSLNKNLTIEHLEQLADDAERNNIEIMISMEGSEKTDSILSIYEEINNNYSNVGITIQAYLNRTPEDLNRLFKLDGKIRLVKGAFEEPAEIIQERGPKLNERYLKLLEQILLSHNTCSIATHDQILIKEAEKLIAKYEVEPSTEFEMLLGVSNQTLAELRKKDYKTRVYLPYGNEWYLYFCHRLAENPSNIYQAIVDMVK
jgi:proline dehydrogenase